MGLWIGNSGTIGTIFIRWIRSLLIGGLTCINFHGQFTRYLECQRGLRQGVPLLPLLWNWAADAFIRIIARGKDAGLFEGFGAYFMGDKGLVDFNYADDTLIFLKADSNMLESFQ